VREFRLRKGSPKAREEVELQSGRKRGRGETLQQIGKEVLQNPGRPK